MKSQLYSLGVAGLVATCFVSFSAQANSGGIHGRSGKQGITCMSGCHGTNPSSTAPEVTLSGPDTLAAGATGSYTLTITGGPAVSGGMNVAVSDNGGTLSPAGSDVKLHSSGELVHDGAKAFNVDTREVSFSFTFTAPSTAQTVTLYASGNSVNGNGNNSGDSAKDITKAVTITGGSTGNPDAGTGNPGDGDGDEDGDGGCSAAGGAPMVLLLALVAAHMRRRRA